MDGAFAAGWGPDGIVHSGAVSGARAPDPLCNAAAERGMAKRGTAGGNRGRFCLGREENFCRGESLC